MIKFLGLLSKKKKVKAKLAANIYVNLLNNVIEVGFVEIKDFINNNNNLEDNPNLTDIDIDWFRNIVFLGNIRNLDTFFEEKDSATLRGYILDELYKELPESEQHLAIERFLDYENYFNELLVEKQEVVKEIEEIQTKKTTNFCSDLGNIKFNWKQKTGSGFWENF